MSAKAANFQLDLRCLSRGSGEDLECSGITLGPARPRKGVLVPAQCFEVQTVVQALVNRLNAMTWEPVEGRELVPAFSSGVGPLRGVAGLVSSHVSEEDMGHKALVTQGWERCASVALSPDPEGYHPRLVPYPEVVMLKTPRFPPPVAGQRSGEEMEGGSCPSCSG